ncbi:MAG: hypothetical protein IKY51_00585 [Alistipes sp.]|nr:hypothetical protein [Alistipes sp.]
MKDSTKITICHLANIASILFLIVGVDYLPHGACWMPILISAFFTLRCRVFYKHINTWLDRLIPID